MGTEILETSKNVLRSAAGWIGTQFVLSVLHFEYDDVARTLHFMSLEANGPNGRWQETQINYIKRTHSGIKQLDAILISIRNQKSFITHEHLENLDNLWTTVQGTIDKNSYPQNAIMYQMKLEIIRLQIKLLSE